MKLARLALAAALAASPALAQDQPAGPGKDPAAPPVKTEGKEPAAAKPEPAKKERKVDPKAVEALEGYAKQLHSPRSMGAKKLTAHGEAESPMFPDPVTFTTTWTAEKGLDADVSLPESILQMIPPEALDAVKGMAKQQVLTFIRPMFGGAGEGLDAYDVAFQPKEGGGGRVTLKPFADGAAMDGMSYEIGKDGLATRWTFAPHMDPSNPLAAQMAGMEYEVAMTYELRGNRNVLKSITLSDPMTGDVPIVPSYYEVAGGFLPKSVEIQSASGSQTLRFFDFEADGKKVEGTAKPKAPEKPAPAPVEKTPEGPKPSDPKAADPKAAEPKDGAAPAGPGR